MRLDTIQIRRTARGYRTEFPYKPNQNAIRGFHSIGMAWQRMEAGVVWNIPADKLKEAQEFIGYWYGEKAEAGRVPCTVEVVEQTESGLVEGLERLEQEAA